MQFVRQRFQPPALGTRRTAVMDSGRACIGRACVERACVGAVGPGACVDPPNHDTPPGLSSRAAYPTIPFQARQTALLLMPPVVVPSWFAVIGILSYRLPCDNLSNSIYWALRDGDLFCMAHCNTLLVSLLFCKLSAMQPCPSEKLWLSLPFLAARRALCFASLFLFFSSKSLPFRRCES